MTDHAELVRTLRTGAFIAPHEREAADAIEQLVRERDAWKQCAKNERETTKQLVRERDEARDDFAFLDKKTRGRCAMLPGDHAKIDAARQRWKK